MAVPLGHKNHYSSRGRKSSDDLVFDHYLNSEYKIVKKCAAYSLDGKELHRLHDNFEGDFKLPKTVKVIKCGAFSWCCVRYVIIPPVIEVEIGAFNSFKLIVFYDIKPHISKIGGEGFVLTPHKVAVYNRATVKEWRTYLNNMFEKNLIPRPVKKYLFDYYVSPSYSLLIEPLFIDKNAQCVYSKKEKVLLHCFTKSKIFSVPKRVRRLDECALHSLNIETLIIPSSVKELGAFAFSSNPELRTIQFKGVPDLVENEFESEYDDLFHGDNKLESIQIPKGSLQHFSLLFPKHIHLLKEYK